MWFVLGVARAGAMVLANGIDLRNGEQFKDICGFWCAVCWQRPSTITEHIAQNNFDFFYRCNLFAVLVLTRTNRL